MRIDDCFELGYIVKTHGLKGEVIIQLDVDDPSVYYEMESVFLEKSGNLIPFFFERLVPQGSRIIGRIEEVDSKDKASELTGCKLFLPIDALPSLNSEEYYLHELVGMTVLEGDNELGVVSKIYQPSAQYLAAVMYESHELLIPIEDDIVKEVNKKTAQIFVELPNGFLDIYTN
ncbi:MAG: ribosome maturation factor RimM [Cyclobacteriaceae bacterium]